MPIKEKSTYKKHEYEYESPDGDKWSIFYVENEGRKYLYIGREGVDIKQCATWDVEMLLDIADQIRGLNMKKTPTSNRTSLRSPTITDHREGGLTRSNEIDSDVQKSMRNFDDNVSPMESFSPPKKDEWMGVRTGTNIESATAEVSETPDEFKEQDSSPHWVDRSQAKRVQRPNVSRGHQGGQGEGQFNRIGAADIL